MKPVRRAAPQHLVRRLVGVVHRLRLVGMMRRRRRLVGVLTAVVLLNGVGVTPALADDEDPAPTNWPTVRAPTEGGADQSDPEPTEMPTVKQPDPGNADDPEPTEWPAPTES
ncbi:hypothetical protein EV138_3544 [Kribbella voronezhensis]|uniref:Uncharacterized protein n=1 Tax=Kribbella voronezhensis TaxID=2512212 RepID=A0A4V3FKF2_9ACTN|nr:hypothetical protein [Kribbella voronezhensis]TDU89963.1 hypothetical protein EV138_3544 [Kribbella voronezhensis]